MLRYFSGRTLVALLSFACIHNTPIYCAKGCGFAALLLIVQMSDKPTVLRGHYDQLCVVDDPYNHIGEASQPDYTLHTHTHTHANTHTDTFM